MPSGDPATAPSPLPIADIMIMALKATRLRHLSPGMFLEWLSMVQWNQYSNIFAVPTGLSDVPG